MLAYIVRRLLVSIPMLIGMTFITFMAVLWAPGNFLAELKANPYVSIEVIEQYEQKYHMNEPAIVQYGYWLRGLVQGDLGYSFVHKRPVAGLIGDHVLPTLLLVVSGMLFTWMVAIPVGVYCAVHQHEIRDRVLSLLAFVGMAIPNFFFALLLLFFASVTGLFPLGGMKSLAQWDAMGPLARTLDVAWHLIVPTIVLGTSGMAGLQRLTRGNMLEALRQQYVLTARAKGLPENRVLYRHALRTAINPLITIFGFAFSSLLGGAALTEIILSWPGLGSLLLAAVRAQDLYLVMGSVLISGVMLIGGNLLADILLALSDPRISYRQLAT